MNRPSKLASILLFIAVISFGTLFVSAETSSTTTISDASQENDRELGRRPKPSSTQPTCPYTSLDDLQPYEKFPTVSNVPDGNGRRHAFQPPADGKVTLVCCESTAGPLSIAVHENWAPLGAQNFLNMVTSNYFSSKIAMFRCIQNWLCQ